MKKDNTYDRGVTFGESQPIDDLYLSTNQIQIMNKSQCSDNENNLYNHNDFQKSLEQLIPVCSTSTKFQKVHISLKNEDGNPFEKELGFLFNNALYSWSSIDRLKKFPLNKDNYCDACRGTGDKKPKTDLTNYLEPGCCHEIHQSCRSRFARAMWDINGYHDGYEMTDCPICYYEHCNAPTPDLKNKSFVKGRKRNSKMGD